MQNIYQIICVLIDLILKFWISLNNILSRSNIILKYLLVEHRVLSYDLYRSETRQLINIYRYETLFQIFFYSLATTYKFLKPIMLHFDEIVIPPDDIAVINFIKSTVQKPPKIHLILDQHGLEFLKHQKSIPIVNDWIGVDAILADNSAIDLTQFFNLYKLSFSLSKVSVESLWEIAKKMEKIENIAAKIKHLETINSNFETQIWNATDLFKS